MFFDYDLCRKWQTGKDAKNRINFDNDENSIDMWKKKNKIAILIKLKCPIGNPKVWKQNNDLSKDLEIWQS